LDVHVDARGDVYVADTADSRVLRYARPHTSGQAADLLFGQPDFDATFCNAGRASADRYTLCRSEAVAVDRHGDVLVADSDNSRVLRYDRSHIDESEPGEDDDHD
jgi:sugar lactone lactonase YvrE